MKCKVEIEMPENITAGGLFEILNELSKNYSLAEDRAFSFNAVNLGFPKGTPIHVIRGMLLSLPRNSTYHMPWSYERKILMVYDDGEKDVSKSEDDAIE